MNSPHPYAITDELKTMSITRSLGVTLVLALLTGLGLANCPPFLQDQTITKPSHYGVASGVTSPEGCCAACISAAPKCQSWTFNPDPSKGCMLRPGPPVSHAKKQGVTSGIVPPPPPPPPPTPAPPGALNVLMIAVDDLRHTGKAFGQPEARTPNIDNLAARSTIFKNAFVQAATCGVSRSSLLTSRRPDTTQVISNGQCPFTVNPNHNSWVSLPEYFARSGYSTHGLGKIFHPNICEGAAVGEQSSAWTEPYYHAPCISLGSIYNHTCYESYPGPLPAGPGGKVTSVYANGTVNSAEDMPDGMIAAHAVNQLQALGDRARSTDAKPFFMAVGFHKVFVITRFAVSLGHDSFRLLVSSTHTVALQPHLPHIAPAEFFDLYPLENISLPDEESRSAPQDAPDGVWNANGEWLSYKDNKAAAAAEGLSQHKHLNDTETRIQRRAYYAAASFVDAQIGKVLAQLKASGLENNTVVALWGDHGWHIGENNEWAKHTAMTWANNAPLLFAVPNGTARVVADGYAEFVDIYPTLADLAGLEVPVTCATVNMSITHPNCTEGASLRPAVTGQDTRTSSISTVPASGKPAAFGQWPKRVGNGSMGYILHTTLPRSLDPGMALVRYTEWVPYNKTDGVNSPIWPQSPDGINELYNRTADPNENHNLSRLPQYKAIVSALSKQLRAGWRT